MAFRPFGFQHVELLDNSLGAGAYGNVVKAKCDGLYCAAKIIHANLADKMNVGAPACQQKFEEECYLLSSARHPNIVQYLGTHYDPDTKLPILLMELCDKSLRHLLEDASQLIPYHFQLNIAHDIVLALVYLHQNGLIHRDLTSNNILFVGTRAKVTDFGMSKVTRVADTRCPGNEFYMSPEALDEPACHTRKLDIFSFGVLLIEIMTRRFPDPGPRLKRVKIQAYQEGSLRAPIAETERRTSHLKLIEDTHPLKTKAIHCLKNREVERPSAMQLNNTLSELKQAPRYLHSVQVDHRDQTQEVIRAHQEEIQQKDALAEQRQRENEEFQGEMLANIQQLRQELQTSTTELEAAQNTVRDKEREFERKEEALQNKEREHQERAGALMNSEDLVAQFQQTLEQKERELRELQRIISAQQGQGQLKWESGKKAPEEMRRGALVVDGNKVYINCSTSLRVYCYDHTLQEQQWSSLPNKQHYRSSLAIIEGTVTSIGGRNDTCTNVLLSLTREGRRQQWTKRYPAMPTPRAATTTITTERAVIVAGGCDATRNLDVVEVMDLTTKQWSTAASLPHPLAMASAALCGNKLYLAGGYNQLGKESKSVMTCGLNNLLQPPSLGARLRALSLTSKTEVWKKVQDLPVTESTIATFRGQLLVIGGRNDIKEATSCIHCYDTEADTWRAVSEMKSARRRCLAAVTGNHLLVVGGYDNDTVEFASLQ